MVRLRRKERVIIRSIDASVFFEAGGRKVVVHAVPFRRVFLPGVWLRQGGDIWFQLRFASASAAVICSDLCSDSSLRQGERVFVKEKFFSARVFDRDEMLARMTQQIRGEMRFSGRFIFSSLREVPRRAVLLTALSSTKIEVLSGKKQFSLTIAPGEVGLVSPLLFARSLERMQVDVKFGGENRDARRFLSSWFGSVKSVSQLAARAKREEWEPEVTYIESHL